MTTTTQTSSTTELRGDQRPPPDEDEYDESLVPEFYPLGYNHKNNRPENRFPYFLRGGLLNFIFFIPHFFLFIFFDFSLVELTNSEHFFI